MYKKYKNLICLFSLLMLSSCSFVHKGDIEQGNIITADQVNQLHIGMNENQVREVMGNPVLTNIFTLHRLDYVYTLQTGYRKRTEKRVTCLFQNGRLVEIRKRTQ